MTKKGATRLVRGSLPSEADVAEHVSVFCTSAFFCLWRRVDEVVRPRLSDECLGQLSPDPVNLPEEGVGWHEF